MDEMRELLQQGVALLGPNPYVQAAGIVIFFLVLARVARFMIAGALARLVAQTNTDLDDRFISILRQPVFSTVAIIGLVLATYRLGLSERFEQVTQSLLQTILIIIWITFALRFSRLFLDMLTRSRQKVKFIQPSTLPLMNNMMAVFLVLAGVYSVLVAWDINVTGLVASAGIVGLALSFAAQDTLANLFAGVAILADRPYKLGDYVNLDTGERGEVTHIGLRSTRLLTRDDVEISVPNGIMGSAKIVNETGGPHEKYRARVSVGVAYGSDIDQVMEVLQQAAVDHPDVCDSPEPRVRFRNFGNSSLDFELLFWIRTPSERGLRVHELNCEVYRRFAAHGIQIPFPQQDIYIKELPASR